MRDLQDWSTGGLRSFLEIFALCGFAVVQPVLEVMGRSPDYFLFRQADRSGIVFLAVAIAIVPPVFLWLVETIAGIFGAKARRIASVLIRGGLLMAIGIQVLKIATGLDGPALLAVAGLVIGAAMLALLRYRGIRLWLKYLIPAPVIFTTMFLAFSPVSDLVWQSAPATATIGSVKSQTPVVVLLLDEFPLSSLLNGRGEIDARLYPNFARLAQGSTWFRNTTGVAAYTPFAVPAMLSGRYPKQSLAPTAALYPETLFTLLSGSHELVAYETVTSLCPPTMCRTADVGPGGNRVLIRDAARVWEEIISPRDSRRDMMSLVLEETVEQRKNRYSKAGAKTEPDGVEDTDFQFGLLQENQPARFSDFLTTLRNTRQPNFWFLHLLLPHAPFRYLPSGQQYEARAFETEQAWPFLQLQQRHLLQTVYTDTLLGKVIDRLEATGLYDRSLLVVVADHGRGFSPGGIGRTIEKEAADVAWVPFFIKAPGQQASQVSDANVQTIDLLPTVADILGIPVPWPVDGISAVGPTTRSDGAKPFHGEQTLQADEWFPKVLRGVPEMIARPNLGPDGLFAIGPFAELVGARVEDQRLSESHRARAAIDGRADFDGVDPAKGRVPALVSGHIEDAKEPDTAYSVAVAINGTIGGVSEVFEDGDKPRKFAAMVSGSLFVHGKNQVQLYLVKKEQGSPTLFPVQLID